MMKANEENQKEYDKSNASYILNTQQKLHATKQNEKLGTEEYIKEIAKYEII